MPEEPDSRMPGDPPAGPPEAAGADEKPLFQHPTWMLGVVLVFAVAAIVAGLGNPVWFLIGAPCILVLAVWLWVRLWGGGR